MVSDSTGDNLRGLAVSRGHKGSSSLSQRTQVPVAWKGVGLWQRPPSRDDLGSTVPASGPWCPTPTARGQGPDAGEVTLLEVIDSSVLGESVPGANAC